MLGKKSNFLYSFAFLFFLIATVIFPSFELAAQQENNKNSLKKYWVFFTDKNGATFDPFAYFDSKTIERRINYGIPLDDFTDFPLNENYINSVRQVAEATGKSSRWLNALVVFCTEEQIIKIKEIHFVKEVKQVYNVSRLSEINDSLNRNQLLRDLQTPDSTLLSKQIKRMGGDKFIEKGIDGKGVRIAVFDAGFPYVDTHPAYEHLRDEKRILKTYDFVSNKEFVYGHNSHGAMVLSCIAGILKERNIGLATGAEFILARTEQAWGEPFSEEENWVAAAEWADKNGADIISSSLGYTFNRYFPEQMDGKTSLVSRAANIAAAKGMLVVNAAGNDGSDNWKHLGAPADADSALTIGGISPATDYHISFSSYGPTADMRRKPNVSAYGSAIVAGKKGLEHVYGTSFATPLVAGFAACAWQLNRQKNNMQMFHEIEKSAHLYPYFDYAQGYGIPQASYFTDTLGRGDTVTSFNFIQDGGVLKIKVDSSFFISKENKKSNLLYYHIQNKMGYLDKYAVIDAKDEIPIEFDISEFKKGDILRVHYRGFMGEYQF